MFSFGRAKSHQSKEEIRSLLYRITDLTSPNLPPLDGEERTQNRSNRSLPILLAPWINNAPNVDEVTTALTKDFSDRGLSVVLHQPLRFETVVVGLLLSRNEHDLLGGEPRFVLGEVRQNVPLGGGFWQLGIEFSEILSVGYHKELKSLIPLTAQLVPNKDLLELPNA